MLYQLSYSTRAVTRLTITCGHINVQSRHYISIWGELASHERLLNPLSQFSRLGTRDILHLLYIHKCLLLVFVYLGGGGDGLGFPCLSVSFFYSMASMLYTYFPTNFAYLQSNLAKIWSDFNPCRTDFFIGMFMCM